MADHRSVLDKRMPLTAVVVLYVVVVHANMQILYYSALLMMMRLWRPSL